jgi:hypothetical protein
VASTSAGWLLFAVKRAWTAPPSDFFAVSLSTLSCIFLLNPISPATLSQCLSLRLLHKAAGSKYSPVMVILGGRRMRLCQVRNTSVLTPPPDVRSSVPTNKDASQMVLLWSIVTWHVGNVTGEYGYGSALTMFAYPQSCI